MGIINRTDTHLLVIDNRLSEIGFTRIRNADVVRTYFQTVVCTYGVTAPLTLSINSDSTYKIHVYHNEVQKCSNVLQDLPPVICGRAV